MTINSDAQFEIEELRSNNFRLNSTVQELRLEIAYYQGETKRLEWEKNLLKQDVGKMSALFKGWLNELQNSNARSVLDDSDFFSNLVKYPSKNISDVMQMNNAKLLITTCQAPFYIEYTNKAWTLECGWDSHEVLGLTCAFLQGELTDIKTAAAFTKDVKEVGYGSMRINNYRKNGDVFNASITVFPIYDSVVTGEAPVLTHFATLLNDVRNITLSDIAMSSVPPSVSRMLANNVTAKQAVGTGSGSFMTSTISPSQSSIEAETQTSPLNLDPELATTLPSAFPKRMFDRRVQSRRFDAECRLTAENFEKSASAVRISDLLRLMLTCVDAMVLTDKAGRIVHCNRQWTELTGYTLTEVEGSVCSLLQGSMTDQAETRRCSMLQKQNKISSMRVVNYRKDGSMFVNQVTSVPIRGGFKTNEVTHFCALLLPQRPEFTDFEALMRHNTSSYRCSNRGGMGSEFESSQGSMTSKRQICDVNSFDCEDSDEDECSSSGYKTPKVDDLDLEKAVALLDRQSVSPTPSYKSNDSSRNNSSCNISVSSCNSSRLGYSGGGSKSKRDCKTELSL